MVRGFITLDDIAIIEKQKGFIEYQNSNYFFKRCKRDLCYRELIAHEIASFLNVHSILYKPACLINEYNAYDKGVISRDYRIDGFNYIGGYDILKDYFDEYLRIWHKDDYNNNSKYNNLEDIYKSLIHRFSFVEDGDKKAKEILSHIIKEIYLFDLFFQNSDRHFNNWEVIENINVEQVTLNALYDNEDIFLDYQSIPNLKCSSKNNSNWYEELKEFLLMTDNEYFLNVKNMYNRLTPKILIKLLEFTERKHQVDIPLDTKKSIITKYIDHYGKIGVVIKEVERNSKKIILLKK